VDDSGAPIGMVSEGDLIGRDEAAREARRDWWLALLAEGAALNEDFLASLRSPKGTARDVMSAPVVTVDEDTPLDEIARLLGSYRIKRVPVVRDGRIVGIVSRAVNAPQPDWPKTLRGEAAELYLRWERDLKPHGFGLAARVLDFPGGMPGDVGLFLVGGE
jgi:hypothetical protein